MVLTKVDLETALARQETKLIKQMYGIAALIIAAVGLMLKFL